MGKLIESAVNWALSIANDNTHGYDQSKRWGPDYDCSSLIISAYEYAGAMTKTNGATYTGNMRSVFLRCGFIDVTDQITLSTGKGLRRGDVLINTVHHTAMVVTDGGGMIVHASINERGGATGGTVGDQTGREICTRGYYNYPWNTVLRYVQDDDKEELTMTQYDELKAEIASLKTESDRKNTVITAVGEDLQKIFAALSDITGENYRQNDIINMVGADIAELKKAAENR